jgi:hypothetical protein
LPPEPNRAEPRVAVQILDYLERNPDVADSLEGIARWRLMQDHIQRTVQETQVALEWLVKKGFVSEEKRLSAGVLYRLNLNRRNEIADFLNRAKRQETLSDGEKG